MRNTVTEQYLIEQWLRSKGCVLWPSLNVGDLSDENELEAIAEWLSNQFADFDKWMKTHHPGFEIVIG